MNKLKLQLIALFCFIGLPSVSLAIVYPLPLDGSSIIGENQLHILQKNEKLTDIARQYNVGYYELIEANPNLNPLDLIVGSKILVPTQFILPQAPRQGIVINLAELRLYYYLPGRNAVLTEPVGIGKRGWETPIGTAKIKDHRQHPTWTVPKSIRDDMARKGIYLPPTVPPGPDNPLGDYAMRLTLPGYVIHSTNRPSGVGRRVSAGCFRLYPEGMERLFNEVDVGVDVNIINQVFKAGWGSDGKLYLEVHKPLYEQRKTLKGDQVLVLAKEPLQTALNQRKGEINWEKVYQVGRIQTGIPIVIGMSESSVLLN